MVLVSDPNEDLSLSSLFSFFLAMPIITFAIYSSLHDMNKQWGKCVLCPFCVYDAAIEVVK